MKLKIEIDLDNAAFEESINHEINRILVDFIERRMPPVLVSGDSWNLFDVNGNKIGKVLVTQ